METTTLHYHKMDQCIECTFIKSNMFKKLLTKQKFEQPKSAIKHKASF